MSIQGLILGVVTVLFVFCWYNYLVPRLPDALIIGPQVGLLVIGLLIQSLREHRARRHLTP